MVIPCKENSLGAINGYSGSSYQDFSPLWREDTFAVGCQFSRSNWIVVAKHPNLDGGIFGYPAISPYVR